MPRGAAVRRPADTSGPGQLDLALPIEPSAAPRESALRQRTAGEGPEPFDDPTRFFEPWWPGRVALVETASDLIAISTADLADTARAFPEIHGLAGQISGRDVVLEGTLMVLDDDGRPDPHLLRRRLLDPLDRPGEGALVVSDLLAVDGVALVDEPFAQRRARLLMTLSDGAHCVVGRGLRGEGRTLATAVADMGLDAISARRLDAPWRPGPAGDAWLRLPVVAVPSPERRPILALLRRLPLD